MPTTQFSVQTSLTPAQVMEFVTDFGPARAERWPNIDTSRYEVHDQGDGWAEVTEGNNMGWERERYTWDAEAGTITIETLESNLWAAGPGWSYRLVPTGAGTTVHVTLTRQGKSLKGKLVGALIPLAGKRVLAKQFAGAFKHAETA